MADDDSFERDLEGVFEHRAREFSPELRALLEELWAEGVRQGRQLERDQLLPFLAAARGELRRPATRAGVDLALGPDQTIVSQHRIDPGGKITPEDVARAVQKLGPRPAVDPADPGPQMEYALQQELDSWRFYSERSFLETQLPSANSAWRSEFERQGLWYATNGTSRTSGTSRRELFGTWAGTGEDEECPSNSPKLSSPNSPGSSTPATSEFSGTGSRPRGTSGSS